jgi:predicted deacylase
MPSEEYLNYFERHSNTGLSHCIRLQAPAAGAHVVIVGGTHGNEPAGVAAIVAFHRRCCGGGEVLRSGTVTLLLGNPAALAAGERYLERDLNRIFASAGEATVEGRRAQAIRRFFESSPEIACVLDLHSVSIGDFRIAVYNAEAEVNETLALQLSPFDLHLAYHPEHLPGALVDGIGARGGVMVECGNHRSQTGRETARVHIQRVLSHFGVIAGGGPVHPGRPAEVVRYETLQTIVPHENFRFTIPDVATGCFLEAGRRFALDDHGEHLAPQDCYVVVPSRRVRATDHDAGFLCLRRRIGVSV